jgi:hypothetical protein
VKFRSVWALAVAGACGAAFLATPPRCCAWRMRLPAPLALTQACRQMPHK